MICYVKEVDTTLISDQLNELGLKCIVVAGDISFSFHDGKDSMKWSKWNCTESVFIQFWQWDIEQLNIGETIKCLKRGSMRDNDREFVKSVLIECYNLGTMRVKDIAKAIKQQERACLVLRETNEYHYYKKKIWECHGVNGFVVIMVNIALF